MLLTSSPVTPPLTQHCGGGGSTYHAVIRRRFTKSVHCAGLRNSVCQKHWGVPFASLAVPVAHRQHHLHHPHQRLPRMRMMQVMLGMLPMLVRGERGKDLNSERGGKDLREEREKIWGKNASRGKGGKRSLGGKWKSFLGGTGPKAMAGQDLKREEREKIWGKNALRVLRSFPPFP